MCGSRPSCCPHTSMTGTCCIPCRCRRCRRRPCLRRCAIRRRIREASVRFSGRRYASTPKPASSVPATTFTSFYRCEMKRIVLRALLGLSVAVAGAATLEAQDTARLKYVATAHQYGPVGYRDPLGVISPSGEGLAYSIAYRLFVQRLVGGPVTELPHSTAN